MEILTSPDTYRAEPENAWQRLKTRVRKPKELAVLIEIAAWRERKRKPATCRAAACARRCARRHRHPGADVVGSALPRALIAHGVRALALGPRHDRRRQARDRSRPELCCRWIDGTGQNANGATVELLKVLLRMTSEGYGVAAKIIATVDDLEQIAAMMLPMWRRCAAGGARCSEKGIGAQARPTGAGGRKGPGGGGGAG